MLRPSKDQGGFTLIELLVVVALMGLIAVTALPTVGSYFKISMNATARQIASTIKETYNGAMMTGKTMRLVYDLKSGQYWVESAPGTALLDTQQSLEKAERRRRLGTTLKKGDESPFTLEKSVTRKKVSLPSGVKFEDIITQQSKDPITEGTAYSHFFPHGLTEQTIIHLMDQSNHHVSLVLTPLSGRTDVYDRYVTQKEIENK